MRAILTAILLLVSTAPGWAEPLSAEEQSSLNQTRDAFLQALENKKFDVVVQVIPPRIIKHIATEAGATVEELLAAMPALFSTAMADATFHKSEIVTENLDATKVVEDGKEFAWGFAPSRFEMTVSGQKIKVEGHTLALLDAGKWYLVRMSEADKVALIRKVYPFFAGVEFPQTTKTTAQ